ncbi:MAG TPA: restriction endonuclease subunit S [Candidatus Tectomicrobia bacterium]
MTLLPEQWEQIYLGELAALKTGPFGSTLHKSDYRIGGIPVVNPMHIIGGKIVPSSAATIAPETAERLLEFRLQRGDVVLGRRGDMGRCAVVGEAEHGWLCGTGSLIIRPGTALDPHYLQRFLSSPAVISRLEEASVGSTMVNLNQRILLELEVPIPPLAEQKRIADKLDAVFARLDACCERLDRVPTILKRFRQAVLATTTSGELTEEWRKQNGKETGRFALLATLGEVIAGQSPRAAEVNYEGRGEFYVTGPEQWDGRQILHHKWTEYPKRIAPDNSIFVTAKGAGVGKTFLGCRAAIGRDVYAFVPHAQGASTSWGRSEPPPETMLQRSH